VAQPILDHWRTTPPDFPNYERGSWGPTAACELIERDGRRWFELISEDVLQKVAIFKDGDPLFLSQVILALRPEVVAAGEMLMRRGDIGREMYVIVRGEVEVLDEDGGVLRVLKDGACVGEIALLIRAPRTASVRARTGCDLLALDAAAFDRILHDSPHFAERVRRIARERYDLDAWPAPSPRA
jgi:signal-transduction protein with cAMP-binding, CBS, and nucleotidyltransferase domain